MIRLGSSLDHAPKATSAYIPAKIAITPIDAATVPSPQATRRFSRPEYAFLIEARYRRSIDSIRARYSDDCARKGMGNASPYMASVRFGVPSIQCRRNSILLDGLDR
jgi:hypothetical protein